MKALGIAMVSLLAVAGGIAAAAYITKKKLEKENEEDYYDDWDDIDDDDFDIDFDEDSDLESEADKAAAAVSEVNKQNDDLIEDEKDAQSDTDESL